MSRFTLYVDYDVSFEATGDDRARVIAERALALVSDTLDGLPGVHVQFSGIELRRGTRGKVLLEIEEADNG